MRTEFDSKPLPSVCEAYLRITGIDPRASTNRPASDTVAVPCVNRATHKHGDSRPSLHIQIAKDVWTCRVCNDAGGKSTALVVHAGLARDLGAASKWLCPPDASKPPPPPIDQRRIAARYEYVDENGTVLYEVIRYEWTNPDGSTDKTFGQRRHLGDDKWANKLDDVERVPYRYPEIMMAVADGKTVYVAEGEKDVEALWALGLPATTSAQGAQWKWTDSFVEYFRGMPSVVVIGDNDESGRAASRLRAERLLDAVGVVRLVEAMPGVGDKGDVSDWIAAYRKNNPSAEKEAIALALRSALHKVAVVKTAEVDDGSMRAWDFSVLHSTILSTQTLPRAGIVLGVRGIDEETLGLQVGETTVIGARTNVGKTLFVEHVIVQNWETRKVLIFALEMGAKKMHDRLVSRAQSMKVREYRLGGRPDTLNDSEWFSRKQFRIIGKSREATAERIIEEIDRYRPDLVVIDHLRHISGWQDLTGKRRSDVGPAEIMDKLMQAGARMGHHTLLGSQITRDAQGRRPELNDLRDSGSVEEMADNVIMLHRPFKADPANDDVMEIIVRKARESSEMISHMKFIGPIMALEEPRPDEFEHTRRCCS